MLHRFQSVLQKVTIVCHHEYVLRGYGYHPHSKQRLQRLNWMVVYLCLLFSIICFYANRYKDNSRLSSFIPVIVEAYFEFGCKKWVVTFSRWTCSISNEKCRVYDYRIFDNSSINAVCCIPLLVIESSKKGISKSIEDSGERHPRFPTSLYKCTLIQTTGNVSVEAGIYRLAVICTYC